MQAEWELPSESRDWLRGASMQREGDGDGGSSSNSSQVGGRGDAGDADGQ